MFKNLLGLLLVVAVMPAFSADPTKPFTVGSGAVSGAEKQADKSLVLESIIHGPEVHTAVINGKPMQVGDSIGEFRLVAVNDKSVVLRSEEESKKLHIFSSAVIK